MWRKQFIRYAAVGAGANIGAFLLYTLFTGLGLSPVQTISIFYPVHITLTFCLNKKWSFTHTGRIPRPAVRYLIAYIGCYVLNVFLLKFFSGYLGFPHLVVQAAAVVFSAVLLFLGQKYWVFRQLGCSAPHVATL